MHNDEAKSKILQAMSTYPLYERKSEQEHIPSYIPTREELNNAILNYYMYREIGFETFGRFLHELKTTMEEIMPYYIFQQTKIMIYYIMLIIQGK